MENNSSSEEIRKANSCLGKYKESESYTVEMPLEGSQSMALTKNQCDMTHQQSNVLTSTSRISQHQLALSKLQINPIDDDQSLLTPMQLETEQDLTPDPI